VGAAIFGLFCLWLARGWRVWRRGAGLGTGASLAVLLLMASSTTDYPLRTETIAVLFAFCCGLLARPEPPSGPRRESGRGEAPRPSRTGGA
jgi:peptidoglycan/LPS O-acetylase OafA/YrhL